MPNLLVANLEQMLLNEAADHRTKDIIIIFQKAINDWPRSVISVDDYVSDALKVTQSQLRKKHIDEFIKQADLSIYAWEAESLSELSEVFKYFDTDISIGEIVESLKKSFDADRSL